MAKQSKKQKELKRARLVEQGSTKRREIKDGLRKAWHEGDVKQIMLLQRKLNKMKRDSSPSRKRNRCRLTGRPHGYYRLVGLGRNEIYRLAMLGLLPGIEMSSW